MVVVVVNKHELHGSMVAVVGELMHYFNRMSCSSKSDQWNKW